MIKGENFKRAGGGGLLALIASGLASVPRELKTLPIKGPMKHINAPVSMEVA